MDPFAILPVFNGGTLSFKGFENGDLWYSDEWFLDPDLGGFKINNGNNYDNTIDNYGKHPHFYGRLDGKGNMTFTGKGKTKLFGYNEFTGGTQIEEGTLVIEDKRASPSGQINISKGATLELKGDDIALGTNIFSYNGTIGFVGERAHIQSDIETDGAALGLTLYVDSSLTRSAKDENNKYIRPLIQGSIYGAGGITKTGGGSLTLSGINTYLGATFVSEGTLEIGKTGSLSNETNVFVEKNAKIAFRADDTINLLQGQGTVELDLNSNLSIGGGISSNYDFTFDGRIVDGGNSQGSVTKLGQGMLTLSGKNTYTGDTQVDSGVLQVVGSLAGTTSVDISKNAMLLVTSGGSLNDSAAVTIQKGANYIAATNDTIGSISGGGSVKLYNANKTLTVGALNQDSTFSGVISGDGSFAKTGSGILTLSGANTYEGTTAIKGGTLKVSGSLDDAAAVSVSSGATYDVDSTDTIGSIAGAGSVELAKGITLTAGGSNTSTTFSGDISGAGNFTKDGSGTLSISSDNALSGLGGKTTVKTGTIDFGETSQQAVDLVIKESGIVKGGVFSVKDLDNSGAITFDSLVGDSFENAGEAVGGSLSLAQLDNSGSITFDSLIGNSLENAGEVVGGHLLVNQVDNSGEMSFDTLESEELDNAGEVLGGDLSVGQLDNAGEITVASLFGNNDANEFINTGSIEITTSANIDMKGGNDIFETNSNLTLSGILDGGEGDDLIRFGSSDNKLHPFRAAKISNFEQAEQTSGTWDYDGNFKESGIETMTLKGGVIEILDSEHAIFENFVMEAGRLVASLESKDSAPLTADSFDYQGGSLLIKAADQHDPEGTYTVIDAPAASQGEMNELAAKSELEYDGTTDKFSGIGKDKGIEESTIYDVYLQEGSLQLVVDKKSAPEVLADLDCSSPDRYVDAICDPGSPGTDIVDQILDDVLNEIGLPIIGDETFAKLFISGLAPRNIDGPGRGMATYNNLLADTLFERLPLRQFDPVVIEETVVEQQEVIEEDPAPPVRGLWSKSGEVSDEDAQQALDRAIAQNTDVVEEESTMVERLEAAGFVEDPSLTAQYARREGVRAWFRAFGGDDRDSYNDDFTNPYYVNSGGGVLGLDVSVSESIQVGAFVNYGNINLIQQSALAGGGSWNSDGWGGGVRADYWTDNFYVQGLFSATGFSGNQKRNIIEITSQLGDETASGTKSATSYGLAFRVGAPFEAGDFLIEPQFTSTWSFNNENRFTESGAGDLNLTYKDRSTTYLQTDLAIKFAYPIKTGETSELVPSVRVGWLGDWNGNLSKQTIGYRFTNDTADINSTHEATNGVLVEGGLDYTIANINSSSYKVYVRGGIEAWGGTRGTDYRASGGLEWQF